MNNSDDQCEAHDVGGCDVCAKAVLGEPVPTQTATGPKLIDDDSGLSAGLLEALRAALAKDCESKPCIDGVHVNDARRVAPVIAAEFGLVRTQAIAEAVEAILAAPSSFKRTVYEACEPVGGWDADDEGAYANDRGTWGCQPWTSCDGKHYNGSSLSLASNEDFADVVRGLAGPQENTNE